MKKVLVILVVLIALGGAAFVLTRGGDDSTNQTANSPAQNAGDESTETTETPGGEEAEADAVITYTDDGFIPDRITVAVGTPITIVNDSSAILDFASDSHPTHRDNSELNVGEIPSGESRDFTISEPGEWGFHDHYNAVYEGVIIVE